MMWTMKVVFISSVCTVMPNHKGLREIPETKHSTTHPKPDVVVREARDAEAPARDPTEAVDAVPAAAAENATAATDRTTGPFPDIARHVRNAISI